MWKLITKIFSRESSPNVSTIWRVLYAYKIQLTQELKPPDHGKRRQFVQWVVEQSEVNANFSKKKKVIFSDEAHFHLNDFVNTQNCRIWGSKNPHAIHEKQCTHNEQLSGVDFGEAAWFGLNCRDCERHSFQKHDNGVLGASTERHGSGRHVVSVRRHHLPDYVWKHRFIAATISRTNYFKKFWCQLATKITRFNVVRFISLGSCEFSVLCQ